MMINELTGKCHCGKNTFAIKNKPEFQFICYCNDCRLLNSGGHLCGMVFDQAQLQKAKETQTYTYKGGSGNPIIMHFCPVCSTQLYAFPTEYKDKVVVRVNTLDASEFKPQQYLFTETAFPWDDSISLKGM
ncbi:hypothetical protein E3983_12765 [Legionella israelensis]|uniref:CENP-V/GFA domain-containing protein n=2 Tax=Legionella israelensis TaxID=454 RepID=A0AAX1EJC8_9GAMM|nr:GFA family protein [Legionella israelensis]QBR85147.1 hypothetical protein E3983_12765 [Legionella israelensis]QBS09950.1 hypothetical protein E4T55_08830 [Legionella israelensis]